MLAASSARRTSSHLLVQNMLTPYLRAGDCLLCNHEVGKVQPQVSHTSSPTTLFMIHHHFHMLTVLMFTVTEIVISAQLVAEYTTVGVHACCYRCPTIDAKHMMPLLMYSLLVIRSNGGAIKAFYKK